MTVRISVIPGYAAMSRDSLETAMASDKELSALNGQLAELDGDEAVFFEQEHILPVTDRRDNHCLIAIVFAALAVEAYMYDYAARNLGEQFVASHLDRLDVVSKWVIIPRLVTGKGFPKGERADRFSCRSMMLRPSRGARVFQQPLRGTVRYPGAPPPTCVCTDSFHDL